MPLVLLSDFLIEKYNHGEKHAREVARQTIALAQFMPDRYIFSCVFPQSMLDLVPDSFDIEPLGRAYIEQGLDEAAFAVSYPRRK